MRLSMCPTFRLNYPFQGASIRECFLIQLIDSTKSILSALTRAVLLQTEEDTDYTNKRVYEAQKSELFKKNLRPNH
jgi:hypothetical protein